MSQTAKSAPLGRGLSALFGDADKSYQAKTIVPSQVPAADKAQAQRTLQINQLQAGAFQPRRQFDSEAIEGLAASIRERGILQPLLVRPQKDSKDLFEIIAGERRWRAAQLAGLHDVPVVIRDLSDTEALEIGLIENVQRKDLSPLEEAEAYQRLMDEFQHTQESLAKTVGKSRSHIANMMRLLSLPSGVKQLIDEGKISVGHARVLVTASHPMDLAHRIVNEGMNVRQAEALAKNDAAKSSVKKAGDRQEDADIASLEKSLSRTLGLKVTLAAKGKAGSLTLHYQDLEQLDNLLAKLKA